MEGFLKLILPTTDNEAQKTVTLEVWHSPEHSHAERPLFVDVLVRFDPPPWSVFAVSVVGSILAVVFATLLPGSSSMKAFLCTLAAAIIFAIMVESLGLLFVYAKCKLILFKIEVDPNQLLAAFVIGFVGGLTVAWKSDKIRRWFGQAGDVEVR